jgi:hypothetical protein
MRFRGIVLSTRVQAEKHGPSIATRCPDCFSCEKNCKYPPTLPPELERIRTSADADPKAISDKTRAVTIRCTGYLRARRYFRDSAHSIRRRIVSDRDGFGAGCLLSLDDIGPGCGNRPSAVLGLITDGLHASMGFSPGLAEGSLTHAFALARFTWAIMVLLLVSWGV